MSDYKSKKPRVVVIGAGVAGIAAAIDFKKKLDIDVQLFDRYDGPGGTWHVNTYPGCACDIPSHWYSLSSEQNPNWTQRYSRQPEIKAYLESVFNKYSLAKQTRFGVNFLRAEWDAESQLYTIELCPVDDPQSIFTVEAEVLISAIGGFSNPLSKPPGLKGIERFKGPTFHSARWDHNLDLKGKKVGVIGNGASAAQFIPVLASDPTIYIVNFSRTPSWYSPRRDATFSSNFQWIMRSIPFAQTIYRAILVFTLDARWPAWVLSNKKIRAMGEKAFIQYIKRKAPKEYHEFLIPKYEMGCKRIVMDAGYLKALNQTNVELVWDPIDTVTEKGVLCGGGKEHELDVLILGTGFDLTTGHYGLNVQGSEGITITEQWEKQGGPQAYMGTTMAGFPNYYSLLGPNVATGHSSAIASIECQVAYAVQCVQAMIRAHASSLEVTQEAEDDYNCWLQAKLANTVWNGRCKSYYKLPNGKIFATWPGTQTYFWWITRKPDFKHYKQTGGYESIARKQELDILRWYGIIAAGLSLATMFWSGTWKSWLA